MNMSHCRFENTLDALLDCKQALDEKGGIKEYIEEKTLSEVEKICIEILIKLCKEITDRYYIKASK
jgi:hypothetical protein